MRSTIHRQSSQPVELPSDEDERLHMSVPKALPRLRALLTSIDPVTA